MSESFQGYELYNGLWYSPYVRIFSVGGKTRVVEVSTYPRAYLTPDPNNPPPPRPCWTEDENLPFTPPDSLRHIFDIANLPSKLFQFSRLFFWHIGSSQWVEVVSNVSEKVREGIAIDEINLLRANVVLINDKVLLRFIYNIDPIQRVRYGAEL